LQEEVGVKKLRAAKQRLFFLDLDYGAQRKTRDAVEGNPVRNDLISKQPPAFALWTFSQKRNILLPVRTFPCVFTFQAFHKK
jgi:hypothetical protein